MAAATAKRSTTKAGATTQSTPRLLERDPRTLLQDGSYALAGVTHEAIGLVRELPDRLEGLRDEAPARLKELRSEVPDRVGTLQGNAKATLHNQRAHYEARVRDLRERTSEQVDARLRTVEAKFDERASEGRKVREQLRDNERYATFEEQLSQITEQAKATQRQLKAALTSVRKTADVALDAGREQARNAKTQVKAAATSARKSAVTVVEAGRSIAS